MAKKIDEFGSLYQDIFNYNQINQRYPQGKGEISDIINIASHELREQGVSDEDIGELQGEMQRRYLSGDRTFFTGPVKIGEKRVKNRFEDYAKRNLTEILDSTPDQVLENLVVPYVTKNSSVKNGKYEEYDKLVKSFTKELKELQESEESPQKKRELLDKLKKEREEYYEEKYGDNKDLVSILKGLVSDESVSENYQRNLQKKQKLIEDMKKKVNIRDYVKSANLTAEDLIKIYSPLFEESIVRSLQEHQKNQEERRNAA